MLQPPKITQIISKVALFLLPFLLFGLLSGWLFETLCVGLACIVIWHYYNIFQMVDWLWHKRDACPPAARGSWADIFDGVYHQQRKHRKKRKELSFLVKRFRLGAESLPDAAVVFNEDKTIVWCNSLAQKMLGFKLPEDIGNRLDNFLRQPQFLRYLESKNYDEPFEFVSPLDEDKILECRVAPFEKDKWTLITRDITQIKEIEQMRKDFIANVSHELKTPLTVMRGYLEVLTELESPPMPMWGKAHRMMNEQTHRMDALVSQLLTLTKLENNQKVDSAHLINVPKLLNKIRDEALALCDDKHQINLSVEPTLFLVSTEEQIRSAISNLVFNAVRYAPEPGIIDVSWQLDEHGNACFSCKDNGLGIAPEHLSRLTERFYRVDPARARDSGGSGLGLSIVKHILNLHETKLKIKSKVNKGSEFSFIIPARFVEKQH